jgi:outer membrane protein
MSSSWGPRLLIACFALLSLPRFASAQTKVGFINMQRAVLQTAEIQKASAAMTAKYQPRQQALEQLQRDLANIQQQLQTMAGKLTPQAEADLQAQGQKKQRDAQRIQDDLQSDVDAERNEILSKSMQKMVEIVKKLADEKGLDAVVDVSSNVVVYSKPSLDLTAEAIAAYDKAYPVTPAPAK